MFVSIGKNNRNSPITINMVLITGATGFLGAHLTCLLLQKGQIVRALKRESSDMDQFSFVYKYYFGESPIKENLNLEWFLGDILDIPSMENALNGVNKVYHCAAMVSFSQKDAKMLEKVNIEGTANVANLCLSHGIEKLCYVSSTAALGRTGEGKEITEETDWVDSRQNTNYAISKYLAEMEVWRAYEEGLNVVIVNPSVILGVTGTAVGSASIIQKAKNGFPFYTRGQNGFVDVEDVSKIMFQLMESNIEGEQFLCVAENWTFEKLFKTAAKQKGLKVPKYRIRPWMAEIGWRVMGVFAFLLGAKPLITRETARSSQKKYTYSSKKVKDTLGFEFTPLEKTIGKV